MLIQGLALRPSRSTVSQTQKSSWGQSFWNPSNPSVLPFQSWCLTLPILLCCASNPGVLLGLTIELAQAWPLREDHAILLRDQCQDEVQASWKQVFRIVVLPSTGTYASLNPQIYRLLSRKASRLEINKRAKFEESGVSNMNMDLHDGGNDDDDSDIGTTPPCDHLYLDPVCISSHTTILIVRMSSNCCWRCVCMCVCSVVCSIYLSKVWMKNTLRRRLKRKSKWPTERVWVSQSWILMPCRAATSRNTCAQTQL